MHRIILLKIGGRKIRLLKVAGALVTAAAALGVLDAVANIFRVLKQVELATASNEIALQVFGLTSGALTKDIVMGLFMLPISVLLLWLALFVVGAMVYRGGGLVLPIEEEIEEETGK